MRWERVRQQASLGGSSSGLGKRWGHTCNAIKGGSFLYVFGGYGKDNCQTNQVHVFDVAKQIWTQPILYGTPPSPRDSHSCTTVGDNLYVFGGTNGRVTFNDLHILDTSSHTWKCPNVRGEGPEAREGHSAALVGVRLYVFGGCGKISESSDNDDQIYYNDLYIFNTETLMWKRAVTTGNPPSARDSQSCSSWMNKIVVIGGQDEHQQYLSDVHILDTDTLIWKELHTSGPKLTPRAGHVTVTFGRSCYVFGGFSESQNLYNDLYLLDIHTGVWTQLVIFGEAPCPRFSSAGAFLGPPRASSSLVIVGGCNKKLEALDDMFYLNTGVQYGGRLNQNVGSSLSLKKQLKIQCQQQTQASSSVNKPPAILNVDHQVGTGGSGMNSGQLSEGKVMFEAKVSESNQISHTIEATINGMVLRGVVFLKNHSSGLANDQSLSSKRPAISNGDQNNRSKIPRTFINDQAMESKGSSSNGVEAVLGTINNPVDVDVNAVAPQDTVTTVAVAPQETVTPVVTSDAMNQAATQLNMGTVNTASSSIPQSNKESFGSGNAIIRDDAGTKRGS